MANYNIGETIICERNVKNAAGAYTDPATSMNIVIVRLSPYSEVVTSTAMTKDSTGKYHYDFQTAGKNSAKYGAIYTATDGTRITIEKDVFELDD